MEKPSKMAKNAQKNVLIQKKKKKKKKRISKKDIPEILHKRIKEEEDGS